MTVKSIKRITTYYDSNKVFYIVRDEESKV